MTAPAVCRRQWCGQPPVDDPVCEGFAGLCQEHHDRAQALVAAAPVAKPRGRHVVLPSLTDTGNPAAVSLQLGKTWVTARAARRVEELHREILGDPTNPDQPDHTRYPLEPLLAALDARQIPHKWLRQPGIEIHTTRAGRDGLNAAQADRAATALGVHPPDLWAEWDRHEEAA
jgi:hypothetical protein